MTITTRETTTIIEADAKDLRESNTLAGCFGNILRKALLSAGSCDYEESQEDDEEEDEE